LRCTTQWAVVASETEQWVRGMRNPLARLLFEEDPKRRVAVLGGGGADGLHSRRSWLDLRGNRWRSDPRERPSLRREGPFGSSRPSSRERLHRVARRRSGRHGIGRLFSQRYPASAEHHRPLREAAATLSRTSSELGLSSRRPRGFRVPSDVLGLLREEGFRDTPALWLLEESRARPGNSLDFRHGRGLPERGERANARQIDGNAHYRPRTPYAATSASAQAASRQLRPPSSVQGAEPVADRRCGLVVSPGISYRG
jgi:hypothetical protein